jgi:hypothetical protein
MTTPIDKAALGDDRKKIVVEEKVIEKENDPRDEQKATNERDENKEDTGDNVGDISSPDIMKTSDAVHVDVAGDATQLGAKEKEKKFSVVDGADSSSAKETKKSNAPDSEIVADDAQRGDVVGAAKTETGEKKDKKLSVVDGTDVPSAEVTTNINAPDGGVVSDKGRLGAVVGTENIVAPDGELVSDEGRLGTVVAADTKETGKKK